MIHISKLSKWIRDRLRVILTNLIFQKFDNFDHLLRDLNQFYTTNEKKLLSPKSILSQEETKEDKKESTIKDPEGFVLNQEIDEKSGVFDYFRDH